MEVHGRDCSGACLSVTAEVLATVAPGSLVAAAGLCCGEGHIGGALGTMAYPGGGGEGVPEGRDASRSGPESVPDPGHAVAAVRLSVEVVGQPRCTAAHVWAAGGGS